MMVNHIYRHLSGALGLHRRAHHSHGAKSAIIPTEKTGDNQMKRAFSGVNGVRMTEFEAKTTSMV